MDPGSDLLGTLPDLDGDAGRRRPLELGDVEAGSEDPAAGLFDARLRTRRVFVDLSGDVAHRNLGYDVDRRPRLRMKLMGRRGAEAMPTSSASAARQPGRAADAPAAPIIVE
jgi:hypothetical protein